MKLYMRAGRWKIWLIFLIPLNWVVGVSCENERPKDEEDTETQSTDEEDADDGEDTDSVDSDSDSDTTSETSSDTSTETDLFDCTDLPDFTPCELVTYPDRSYDICVNGSCVSPGCGDLSCNVPGPHFTLADTNQRNCYNSGEVMANPPAPEATFYGQDAQYGWDTKNDSEHRYTRDLSTPGQPTVFDNVTGLIWQGCSLGDSGDNCGTASDLGNYNWANALSGCDDLEWGGYTDWRLPDEYELLSIVDFGRSSPSIDVDAFPATMSFRYVTSTRGEYILDFDSVWYIDFGFGTSHNFDEDDDHAVRCVRGEPTPRSTHFSLDTSTPQNPTVWDHVAGLDWQGCVWGLYGQHCQSGQPIADRWSEALAYCEELTWAGYDDWRLPNIKELRSIIYNRWPNLCIDDSVFPATPLSYTWTSSSSDHNPQNAWYVRFDNCDSYSEEKIADLYVRCVRDRTEL